MSNSLVLVLNAGSSSLKFALMEAQSGKAILSGLGECFGLEDARLSWKSEGQDKKELTLEQGGNHHQKAIDLIVELVENMEIGSQLSAVGHRVVHGGEKFSDATLLNEEVVTQIEALSDLAPLHNPANVIGIRAAMKAFPNLPQVAVFDTAFHQSMPAKAYNYAISQKLYRDYGIRRYGFHGTSHYFVSRKAAEVMGKKPEESNVITVHLGNGASVCAIKDGKSVDTSMGFTPLAGLMMGTRCGDLDPSIPDFMRQKGMTAEEINNELNGNSGFLGVSELTSDCRGICEAADEGHEGSILALELFTYRVAKYIASYMVSLDQLDAIVFTGGIGENSLPVRRMILKNLKIFGYKEDEQGNADARFGAQGQITQAGSPLAMVIPTNEEFVIVSQSVELVNKL